MTFVSEVRSSLMTREAGDGFGVATGAAGVTDGCAAAGRAGDVLAGCGDADGLACAFGAGLAEAALPLAGDWEGLAALKLFQLTQPVMATAAMMRRDVLVFMVEEVRVIERRVGN